MKNRILIALLVMFTLFNAKSQELPTIGEVFDFSIGDEYHYISSYGWWGIPMYLSTNKVINVDYALDSNEVNYTIINNFYSSGWDGEEYMYISGPDTLNLIYTNLDSSMYYYNGLFEYDTLNYLNENLCFAEIFGSEYQPGGPWLNHTIVEYAIGLGRTYYSNLSDTGTNLTMLVYYLKEGMECGSLIDISVGVDAYMESNSFSVYPTVFSDHVTIELDRNDNLSVQIFSMTGQELLTKELTSTSQQLDLSFTSPGTYIYIIKSNNEQQILKTGKIIKP